MSKKTKVKVIVADDSAIVRLRTIALLNEVADIEVIGEAEDGLDALSITGELKPDVLILDIQMPGLSGLEVLRRLQKRPLPPKIIMVTNYAFPQYREKCLQAGASYFFDKSAEFDQLAEAVRRLRNDKLPPARPGPGRLRNVYSN